MGGMKYGYARVSTDDQNTGPATRGSEEGRMPNRVSGRGTIGGHNEASCPSPLPEETGTRRHSHSVEARPAGPQSARLDTRLDDLRARDVKFYSLTEAI